MMAQKIFISLLVLISLQKVSSEEVDIGAEDKAAPWSYVDGTGSVNDVVKAAFVESKNWKVKFEVYPYACCKALALIGNIAGCFSTSKTPDLVGKLLFPNYAVIEPRNILYVKKNSISIAVVQRNGKNISLSAT